MAEEVKVKIEANGNGAVKELGRVEKAIKSMSQKAKEGAKQADAMANSLKTLAATEIGTKMAGLATSIIQVGSNCIMAAAQMRQYEIAFQTMLKSAEKGTQMLKDLQKFAAETPFDTPGVVQAGQQLMAFGFTAEQVIPMLRSLGDAAAGLGKGTAGVGSLAYALGQMQTSGKLNTQDMMQLTNAGVSAWDMLAKAAGKSVMEIKDLTSKGAIDSKEAVKIIIDGINQQFGGMMEKTSQEVTGLMANIEETAGNTAATVGKYMIQAFDIKGILKSISDKLTDFQTKMQKAAEEGKSFSEVLKDCVPPGLLVALGAIAAILGGVLVAGIVTAVGAFMGMIGLSAGVVAALGAIGAAVTFLAVYWDELKQIVLITVKLIVGLVSGMATAIVTAIVGMAKAGLETIGEFFQSWAGYYPESIKAMVNFLDNCLENISDFVSKAIKQYNKLFDARQRALADGDKGGAGGGGAFGTTEKVKAPKKEKIATKIDPSKLIINPDGKVKSGATKKTEEERKTDALVEKYKKLSTVYEELKHKADILKIAASSMFGDGKVAQEHYATIKELEAEHLKINKELEDELTLSSQIANSGDRERIQKQIRDQIKAQQELYDAKVKAENYKFDHRNDKSSGDIAQNWLDKALGTDTQIEKKKEAAKKFITEINDMAKNNGQTNGAQDINAGNLAGQASYIQQILHKTPEQLQEEWKTKSEGFATFVDYLSSKMAEATANETNSISLGKQWKEKQVEWIGEIGSSMGNAVGEWISGAKSIGQAMQGMVKSLLQSATQLLTKWLTVFALMSIWEGPKVASAAANKIVLGISSGTVGKLGTYASGGYIAGAGGPTSDKVPAMLSNGEYVIKASAVEQLGIPFLDGLNSGRYHYATGGLVGSANIGGSEGVAANSTSQSVSVNISAIDASGFGSFLANGGLAAIKQALTDDDRMFNSAAGVW